MEIQLGTFTARQLSIIQQMIDATIHAEINRDDDFALATEGYVDDIARGLDNDIEGKADSSVVNDVSKLEDQVNALENDLDSIR